MEYLNYRPGDRYSTIASPEPNLQTVVAEKFVKAYDEAYTLEGAIFDRNGDLYFTSTQGYVIWKVDMKTKEKTRIFHQEGVRPAAVKIHKDGRLFAACVSNETLGGVYYVDPTFTKITPFARNMCQPNGIALSTDGTVLWVTEFQAQRLHRFVLPTGRACVPYHFTGFAGPDSCSVDADENLYVACPDQGRVMVFNKYGSPIGQIVTPGREEGRHLFTTHPMVKPGTRDIYITCKDIAPDTEGSWIFKAGAFAEGNDKAYQYQ